MAVKTIPDKAKRSCVARIKGGLARGKNTVQQEALKMGVSPQAVRKWCRDLGLNTRESVPAAPVKLEAEPIDDPSSPVPPRKPAAAGDASPSADGGAQDKALEAAGLGAGGRSPGDGSGGFSSGFLYFLRISKSAPTEMARSRRSAGPTASHPCCTVRSRSGAMIEAFTLTTR